MGDSVPVPRSRGLTAMLTEAVRDKLVVARPGYA
jgi:hypothetical protein